MMDEEYGRLKQEAMELLDRLRRFPARPFLNEARRRDEGGFFPEAIYAAHLEAVPDPE